MILDHVSLYGTEWLIESWKVVQEDKTQVLYDSLMIMPAARTAMDKKGAKSLDNYLKKVTKAIGKRIPWRRSRGGKLSHLRDKIPSGETRVLLGKGEDGNNPLFQGVKKIRE